MFQDSFLFFRDKHHGHRRSKFEGQNVSLGGTYELTDIPICSNGEHIGEQGEQTVSLYSRIQDPGILATAEELYMQREGRKEDNYQEEGTNSLIPAIPGSIK